MICLTLKVAVCMVTHSLYIVDIGSFDTKSIWLTFCLPTQFKWRLCKIGSLFTSYKTAWFEKKTSIAGSIKKRVRCWLIWKDNMIYMFVWDIQFCLELIPPEVPRRLAFTYPHPCPSKRSEEMGMKRINKGCPCVQVSPLLLSKLGRGRWHIKMKAAFSWNSN